MTMALFSLPDYPFAGAPTLASRDEGKEKGAKGFSGANPDYAKSSAKAADNSYLHLNSNTAAENALAFGNGALPTGIPSFSFSGAGADGSGLASMLAQVSSGIANLQRQNVMTYTVQVALTNMQTLQHDLMNTLTLTKQENQKGVPAFNQVR